MSLDAAERERDTKGQDCFVLMEKTRQNGSTLGPDLFCFVSTRTAFRYPSYPKPTMSMDKGSCQQTHRVLMGTYLQSPTFGVSMAGNR